jgi:hypothetical protein
MEEFINYILQFGNLNGEFGSFDHLIPRRIDHQ